MQKVIVTILAILASVGASKDNDLVINLPGLQFEPSFKQYSGYLQGISDNYQLHYWFVEAESEPENKPLVLWMNGGPGCSSMEGFLTENGPFIVQPGKKLIKNEQSWNQLANMIYLEAPAGVGFSYAKNKNATTDDILTAINNLAALKNFLVKFPEYNGRDFYITGESYGGVYVPTLALQVLQSGINLNLKGIAVGNGLTNYEMNDNSLIYFAAFHGLIGNDVWSQLLDDCCDDPHKIKCHFTRSKDQKCIQLVSFVNTIISSGLDVYNLYSECAGGVNVLWDHWTMVNNGTIDLHHDEAVNRYMNADLGNLFRSNPHVAAMREQKANGRRLLGKNVKLAIPCDDDSVIDDYLNDASVQQAIHVASSPFESPWDVCSDAVNMNYVRTYQELSKEYSEIVRAGVRTVLYNGDVDMACNFIGDEWFVDSLGFTETETRRSWLYVEADGTKQIGGFTKRFSDESDQGGNSTYLRYVTIRGSGHMAPTDKPRSTYRVYESFINNSQL